MTRERKIYDCIMYNGELDVLRIRLNELSDVVDVFVFVEGSMTFSGAPRDISYNPKDLIFASFHDRIRHVVVHDMPEGNDPWARETWLRDAILRGLGDAGPDDLVMISDADEIPRAAIVRQMAEAHSEQIFGLGLQLSYFYLNYCVIDGPDSRTPWTVAVPRSALQYKSPQEFRSGIRNTNIKSEIIRDAGWHFSYLFDLSGVRRKIGQFSHQEYNNKEFLDSIDIEALVRNKSDLFGERGNVWAVKSIDTLPLFVRENVDDFARFILKTET